MEPFIAQIQAFGFNYAPRGWAFCDGQLLAISQNTALFSLLGTTFGGDGRNTFALPDLRGRSIVHVGNGPGLSPIDWGQKGGNESETLTVSNIPSHNHTLFSTSKTQDNAEAQNNLLAASATDGRGNPTGPTIYANGGTPDAAMQANAISNAGGGQSFNIRNPYMGIYTSIALVGIFPSRS